MLYMVLNLKIVDNTKLVLDPLNWKGKEITLLFHYFLCLFVIKVLTIFDIKEAATRNKI